MTKNNPDKILIASNNQGKIKEISSLLQEVNIQGIAPKSLPEFNNFKEPPETGVTFAENSFIKAKFYGQKSGLTSLADDSGICIVDLDNSPGIHSARFALNEDNEKDFNGAFQKIFWKLQEKNISLASKPKAYFICNLTIYDPKNDFHQSFEGRVDGYLTSPIGEKGFGYDPIFIKNSMDKTFGQIEPCIKDKISHRGDAFNKFLNWLKSEKS